MMIKKYPKYHFLLGISIFLIVCLSAACGNVEDRWVQIEKNGKRIAVSSVSLGTFHSREELFDEIWFWWDGRMQSVVKSDKLSKVDYYVLKFKVTPTDKYGHHGPEEMVMTFTIPGAEWRRYTEDYRRSYKIIALVMWNTYDTVFGIADRAAFFMYLNEKSDGELERLRER